MTDLEILQQFYQQILWADQCHEVIEEERTLLITPCALCVPCRWQDYEQSKAFIIPLAQKYTLSAKLLVWGEPSDYQTEKIWWDAMLSKKPNRVYVSFLDVQASVLNTELMLKVLEGADIQKTVENFLAGKWEAVWTWDEKQS
jgi:hypothetical protein